MGSFFLLILCVGFFLIVGRLLFGRFRTACPPNHALVIYRGHQFRVVQQGSAFHWPVWEHVQQLSLQSLSIGIFLEQVTTKDEPITLTGLATIRISTNPDVLRTAVQQLAGNTPSETQFLGMETLEKHLRSVLVHYSLSDINTKRRTLSLKIAVNSAADFRDLGLEIETFIIQGVSA